MTSRDHGHDHGNDHEDEDTISMRSDDPDGPSPERTVTGDADADADATIPEVLLVPPTHQVNGVDLRSLAVFSSLFYATSFLALGLGLVVVWLLASAVGVVGQFEEFMQSIGFSDFHVVGPELIFGSLLLGASLVIFLTVMTVLAGAFYNLMASYGRGVKLRVGVVPAPPAEPVAAPSSTKQTKGKNAPLPPDDPKLAAPAIAVVRTDEAATG